LLFWKYRSVAQTAPRKLRNHFKKRMQRIVVAASLLLYRPRKLNGWLVSSCPAPKLAGFDSEQRRSSLRTVRRPAKAKSEAN
jgi:hypothetical protein